MAGTKTEDMPLMMKKKAEEESAGTAVVVVVVVIVILLLLAFFWCSCSGGRGGRGNSCTFRKSKSYVPFSLGFDGGFTAVPSTDLLVLGDGVAYTDTVADLNLQGGAVDATSAAFTRNGSVGHFTVHALLNGTTAPSTVTVTLFVSPQSAATQPAFAAVQSVSFAAPTTTATYFYQQLTTNSNVKAGDRYAVVAEFSATTAVTVLSGGFEYSQCP